MKFIWDSPLCVEFSSSLSPLLRFGFEFSSFGVFCVWRRPTLEFVLCWTLCDDSDASSIVPNPLESWVLTNWSFCVLEKTPIHFDLPLNSQDPLIFWERSLGDMFTGQMWMYPPSFVGFRLRSLEICHLEHWLRAVWKRPVWVTGLTGLWLPGLKIFSFASVFSLARSRACLCWFSSSIAIPNFP